MVPNSLKKSAIRVAIKQAIEISGTNQEVLIPFTKIQEQNSNGFKVLSDGIIQATKNMNVYISILLNIYDVLQDQTKGSKVILKINNVDISIDQHSYSSQFNLFAYVKLQKNDIIKITASNFHNTSLYTGSSIQSNHIDIFEI